MRRTKHIITVTPSEIKGKLKEALDLIGSLKVPKNLPKLDPVEMKLFLFLLSKPCCLFPKREVEKATWGERKITSALTSTIWRANLKIANTGWGIILNVRGQGYGWFPEPECVFFDDK